MFNIFYGIKGKAIQINLSHIESYGTGLHVTYQYMLQVTYNGRQVSKSIYSFGTSYLILYVLLKHAALGRTFKEMCYIISNKGDQVLSQN